MSRLDIVKETIAYLKFWLGILAISNISLFGWLLTRADTPDIKGYGAVIGIFAMTISALGTEEN